MTQLTLLFVVAALNVAAVVGNVVPNQYIVTFKPHANEKEIHSWATTKVQEVRAFSSFPEKIHNTYNINDQFKGMSGKFSKAMLDELRKNPDVLRIEPDEEVRAYDDGELLGAQPNATWGITRISQRAGPNYDLPYQFPNSAGEGVTAYIIDTGILANHTDFGGRAVQAFKADASFKDYDDNGHGTHCAGTVGSSTYGVAKKVKLVGVKVLNGWGSGTWSGVVAGINWVANEVKTSGNKRNVINMSLGGNKNQALNDAVEAAIAGGCNFAVAAGNENRDACLVSPASAKGVFSVAASDKTDKRASFSNFGNCTDLFAPGVGVTSTWNDGKTNTISGTSMASPHVCGVMALFLGENGNLTPAQLKETIVAATTLNVIQDTKGAPNKLLFNQNKKFVE